MWELILLSICQSCYLLRALTYVKIHLASKIENCGIEYKINNHVDMQDRTNENENWEKGIRKYLHKLLCPLWLDGGDFRPNVI